MNLDLLERALDFPKNTHPKIGSLSLPVTISIEKNN